MLGVFDKAFPNFEPVKRTTQGAFNKSAKSFDPNFTTYKPYGYKIDEDPENIAMHTSKEALEFEAKIFDELKMANTQYAGKQNK